MNIMDTFFFLIRFIIFAFLTGVDEHRRDRGKTFGRNKVAYHLLYDLCLKDYKSAQMLADFLFEMRLSIPHLTHLLD